MPAFDLEDETGLFNYFRYYALQMDCNPCFDSKKAEIHAMNEKGSDGVPECLCRKDTPCPCRKAAEEIENNGMCYCEIFRRK